MKGNGGMHTSSEDQSNILTLPSDSATARRGSTVRECDLSDVVVDRFFAAIRQISGYTISCPVRRTFGRLGAVDLPRMSVWSKSRN